MVDWLTYGSIKVVLVGQLCACDQHLSMSIVNQLKNIPVILETAGVLAALIHLKFHRLSIIYAHRDALVCGPLASSN